MNPQTILTSKDTLNKIETVCKRRFPDRNDADECYLFIIESLEESDYRRLRAFKGKSSLKTYLYTLVNSLAADFNRKKYGRRRIPKIVSKLGLWAEAVYRFVCWQKFSFDDAYDMVSIQGLFSGSFNEFLDSAEPIRHAPCPENPRFVSGDADVGDTFSNTEDQGFNPLEALIEKLDRERRIRAGEIIREVTSELSDEDQILVKLVYGSDHSAAAAAKVLGISPPAARKRLKSLLIKYKAALLAEGIRES